MGAIGAMVGAMMDGFARSCIRLLRAVVLVALVVGCQTGPAVDGDHGKLTSYSLTLRHFSDREAITIMRAMREDFPGYRTHDLISKTPEARRYEYRTTAKAFKLEEWLYGLLRDLGFDTSRDTLVEVQGTRISVDKLAPRPPMPLPPDEPEEPPQEDPDDGDRDKGQWKAVTE